MSHWRASVWKSICKLCFTSACCVSCWLKVNMEPPRIVVPTVPECVLSSFSTNRKKETIEALCVTAILQFTAILCLSLNKDKSYLDMTIKCVDTPVGKNSLLHVCVKAHSVFKDWNDSFEQTQLPGNHFKHFSFPPLRHKPPSSSTLIYINWFLSHGMSNPLIWRSQNFRHILASLSSVIFFSPRCRRYWFVPGQLIMTRMSCSGSASLNVTSPQEWYQV